MKKLLLLILTLGLLVPAYAQFGPARPAATLTDEECRLLEAFRQDPEPFRRILGNLNAPDAGAPDPAGYAETGPRDLIDVVISGGRVAFYGKPREFEPCSFRIARGQEAYVVFRQNDSITETRVKVAYRADGLHFDVPEAYGQTAAPERGYLVIPEDSRWYDGTPIAGPGRISQPRSLSRAENLSFQIHYAFSARTPGAGRRQGR
ncbi:MAG: hypothetical protein PHE83_17525 [Opitutaceae bacterium]|nr:hypothetical protein [Opitutaceae bacterium]